MSVRDPAADTLRDGVPFLVATGLWLVVLFGVYGLFLLSVKARGAEYGAAVHVTVFLVPAIGYAGHVLRLALATTDDR